MMAEAVFYPEGESEIPIDVLTNYKSRTIVEVLNPRWVNAEHTMFDADILFEELSPMGHVPFSATPNADTAHGVEIWEKGIAGAYGEIAEYSPPAPDLQAYTAQKRWEKENGGIVVGGAQIATDDRSKVMISGARVAAEADPNFSTEWKAADGSFVTVDATMIIAISDAMLAHVSNSFALEAQVLAQIEAGTITTTQEIDAAFA